MITFDVPVAGAATAGIANNATSMALTAKPKPFSIDCVPTEPS